MSTSISTKSCPRCQKQLNKKDVVAIGIREGDTQPCYYIEYQCSKCKGRGITPFNSRIATIEKLCYVLLESVKHQKELSKSKEMEKQNKNTSPISDKEVKAFMKFLNKSESHEDFLVYIKANEVDGGSKRTNDTDKN